MCIMCIDWPCCGHEAGCCPSFDDSGRQLDMVCTCGKRLPVDNRSSICDDCLDDMNEEEEYFDEDRYDESMDGDFDSGMTSAGFGTDEDYGDSGW
jgi:hypothetical protein